MSICDLIVTMKIKTCIIFKTGFEKKYFRDTVILAQRIDFSTNNIY